MYSFYAKFLAKEDKNSLKKSEMDLFLEKIKENIKTKQSMDIIT